MTNKELKEEITRLKTALAELEEKVEALPKRADGGVFKPEDGQEYWYISGSGKVYGRYNNLIAHNRYSIGNCFSTRQLAEDTVRVLILIRRAKESQDGFVPDWENAIEIKYVLCFDWLKGKVCVTNYHVLEIAPIFGFWKNKSACDQFIQDNHDELIWFFTEYRR